MLGAAIILVVALPLLADEETNRKAVGGSDTRTTANLFAKAYGGNAFDRVQSVQQARDGGYIMVGDIDSFGIGGRDIWVVKVDRLGSIEWQKTYGTTGDDYVADLHVTNDGGCVVAGAISGGIWLLKIGSSGGHLQWQRTYGVDGGGLARCIRQTRDGGYIVAGGVYGYAWLLRLSAAGQILWQNAYGGGDGWGLANAVALDVDGGYVVAGSTTSYGAGGSDMWILKIDSAGTVKWQRSIGGTKDDAATTVTPIIGGGYLVGGYTYSFPADRASAPWAVKLSPKGNVVWQQVFGGNWLDGVWSVQQMPDGNYIVLARNGGYPWLAKLRPKGNILWQRRYHSFYYIDGRSEKVLTGTAEGGFVIAADCWTGKSTDFGLMTVDRKGNTCSSNVVDTDAVPIKTKAWITSTPGKVTVTRATVRTTAAGPVNTQATVTDVCE